MGLGTAHVNSGMGAYPGLQQAIQGGALGQPQQQYQAPQQQQYQPPQQPAQQQPQQHQIQTSIQPGQLYNQGQINARANQARASHQQNSLPFLLGQMGRPGMSSRSPATMARAMPQYAMHQMQGKLAGIQSPFQDKLANANFNMQGQVARENQAMGSANMVQGLDDSSRRYQFGMGSSLLNFLGGI